MAILAGTDLAAMRQNCCASDGTLSNDTKPVLNAALQAIEDTFEAGRTQINNAINTATSPVVLTAAQKKLLIAAWCDYKFGKGG